VIPKKIHIIWVGDETRRPNQWIQTWIDSHPSWDVKVWGNDDLKSYQWRCQNQIDMCIKAEKWEGVADIMRYEILHDYGGIYIDADSVCLKPLDDLLPSAKSFFAVYEHEIYSPGLIANGYMGCVASHAIALQLMEAVQNMKHPLKKWSWKRLSYRTIQPWKTIGPKLLTKVMGAYQGNDKVIFPSKIFLPVHYKDKNKDNIDLEGAYATHYWGTSKDAYDAS
jgi:mannosyltransferase OCH1-like enzyme